MKPGLHNVLHATQFTKTTKNKSAELERVYQSQRQTRMVDKIGLTRGYMTSSSLAPATAPAIRFLENGRGGGAVVAIV